MERVETLLQKLSEQFNEGANSSQLLLTVQMLQHELLHLQKEEGVSPVMANVHMPTAAPMAVSSVSNKPVAENTLFCVYVVPAAAAFSAMIAACQASLTML